MVPCSGCRAGGPPRELDEVGVAAGARLGAIVAWVGLGVVGG